MPEPTDFSGLDEVLNAGGEGASNQATQAALDAATGSTPARPPWWPEFIEWPPVTQQVDNFGRPTGTTFDPDLYDQVFSLASSGRFGADVQQRAVEFQGQSAQDLQVIRDPETGQNFFRTGDGKFQAFTPPSTEESILSLNQQIDKALFEGDFQMAAALADIQDRPDSLEVFDRALAFAKSPGDQLILQNIRAGLQNVPRTPGRLATIPKNAFLTQAFLDLTKDPFESARLISEQARPTPVADQVTGEPTATPTPLAAQQDINMESQRAADRSIENADILQQLGQPRTQRFESQIGEAPVFPRRVEVEPTPEGTTGGGGSPPISERSLAFARAQDRILAGEPLGLNEPGPLVQGEEFPTLGSMFGTDRFELGPRLDPLQLEAGGGPIERGRPVLPQLGLRGITGQGFSALAPSERRQLLAVAQLQGLTEEDVMEEIRRNTLAGGGLTVRRR